MPNQLASFDPVGAFQGARSRARGIQAQEQALDLQPKRNELAQLKIDSARQDFDINKFSQDQQKALSNSKLIINANQALKRLPLAQRTEAARRLMGSAEQSGFDTSSVDLTIPFTDQRLNDGIREALTISKSIAGQKDAAQFTLSPGQKRFQGSQEIASVEKSEIAKEIPGELLAGLSEGLASKGAAAFKAAGGGKDGLKAFGEAVKTGTEQERRISAPAILRESYPEASPNELIQLRATMDAAKTTESGLKAAAILREDQRRVKIQGKLVDRAHSLLLGLKENTELSDVVGSIEGSDNFLLPRSDGEATAIADIEEVSNILTADKLKLMSGVLSETDIKILTNLAGGGLNRKRKESRFRDELDKMISKLDPANRVNAIDSSENDQLTTGLDVKRARLAELRARAQR